MHVAFRKVPLSKKDERGLNNGSTFQMDERGLNNGSTIQTDERGLNNGSTFQKHHERSIKQSFHSSSINMV